MTNFTQLQLKLKQVASIAAAICLLSMAAMPTNAQILYSWSTSTGGTYTQLTGPGITVINQNSGLTAGVMTANQDDGAAIVTLPFSFNYNGNSFTTVTFCTNGWIGMGNQSSVTATQSRANGNLFTTTPPNNTIAPWFKDMGANFPATQPGTGPGSMRHGLTGTEVYTFQWDQAVGSGYGISTANLIRFQVSIYGPLSSNPGRIQFLYGSTNGSVAGASSRGIENATGGTGNYINGLNGLSNSTTTSATWPGNGSIVTFDPLPPCVVPTAQPTGLTLTAISTSQIDGSFTAATGSPTGYVVVRYPAGSVTTNPVDGTTYTAGQSLGLGTVVSVGTATTFNNTFLAGGTSYDYYVYAFNNTLCTGGPVYNTTTTAGQNFATQSTNPCGTITSPVSVGPTGTYPTLTAALAAVASTGISAPLLIELQSTYTGLGETFPITFNFNPCVTISNPITIRPEAATASVLTITSSNATATFDFNGAQYITVDGRPGGTGTNKFLRIENTGTTGQAILLRNDASHNTLTYLDVRAANTNAANNTSAALAGSTIPGAVAIGTTTGMNGNDNNTISFCDIHSVTSGGNLCVGLYAYNSTAAGSLSNNDNNTITENNIYDIFHATVASAAINISLGNNTWTVTNNNIYQTGTRTYTGTQTVRAMWITPNTGAVAGADGFVIEGNYMGGDNPTGSGTMTMTGTTGWLFTGMDLSLGLTNVSSVQGNTITSIASTSGNTGSLAFLGIGIANGFINLGTVTGNVIGTTDGTVGINFTATANTGGFLGIRVGGGNTVNVANNTIGGIQLNASVTTVVPIFNGINVAGGTTININNNTIGHATQANSINMITASTSTSIHSMRGIVINVGTPTTTVTGNLIANMNSNCVSTGTQATSMVGIQVTVGSSNVIGNTIRNLSSSVQTTSGGGTSAMVGISYTSTTAPATISGNTIHTLQLTHPSTTAATANQAIFFTGPTTGTNVIEKNFIHSLSITSPANTTGYISGMDVGSGTATIKNNMIRLGIDADGNSITQGIMVRGISSNSGTMNVYHNSVYIGGSGVLTSAINSFAYQKTGGVVTNLRNNILVNERSNATTGGKHYSVYLNTNTSVTVSHNQYYGNGTNYVFAFNGTADVPAYAGGWITGDNNSQVGNPQFIDATGNAASVDLHIHPTNLTLIEQNGVNIASVTDDFDSQSRPLLTPDDIGADAGNFVGNFCTVGPVSVTAVPSNATPICGSGTKVLTLSGYVPQPGFTYQWQESPTGLSGSFVDVTGGTGGTTSSYTTATLTSTTFFQCIVACAYGGTPTTSNVVQVEVNPVPVISVTPSTGTSVCSGSKVDLSATGADTYSWAVNPGVSGYPVVSLLITSNKLSTVTSVPTSTLASSTAAPPATVSTPVWTYTVTGTSAAGCTATASTALTVITNPVVPLQLTYTTVPSPVCSPGSPVVLTVNNTGTIGAGQWVYNWYDQAGTTLLQSTTNASASDSYTTPATTVNGNNIYTVKVSNTVCPNSYAKASPTFFVGYTSLNVESNPNCGDNGTITVYPEGQTNFTTWYSNDFSTGLQGPAYDGIYGSANIGSGRCNITNQSNSQNGAFVVRNPASINTNNLQVDFNLSTHPRGFAFNILGADGIAWSYGPDVVQGTITIGANGFNAESGSGSGFKLAFDATANGAQNTPGCYLMYNCNTPDQGPLTPGVLAFKQGSWWQGLVNAPLSIIISQNGFVTVTVNNEVIFDHVPLPQAYLTANKSNWIHSFTARTGGSNELHAIDNLNIRYNTYEYSINSTNGTDGTWQTSNMFTGLSADTFDIWVRNPSDTVCFANTGEVILETDPSPTSANTVVADGYTQIICPGNSTTLTTSVNVAGAVFAWEESVSAGGPWFPAAGTNNLANYTTPALTNSTFYRCTFTCPSASAVVSNPIEVIVNTGIITATNSPQLISCQGGNATLTATPGAHTQIVWYANAVGGTPLFSGNSYTVTPSVLPAIYYAEPVSTVYSNLFHNGGQNVISNGFGNTSSGTGISTRFTTNQSLIIDSIKVVPGATGTLTVALQNNGSATNIASVNFTITSAMVGNFTNIPLNINVPGSGNYQLTTSGVSCTYFSSYTGTYAAPYMNMGSGSLVITAGATSPTGANSTTVYGTAFRWSISTSCPGGSGNRIPVYVNVDPSTVISTSPSTSDICLGDVEMLVASSPNAYDNYSWLPASGLYFDALATVPYVAGTDADTIYAKPTGTTQYTVTGTEAGPGPLTGCTNISKSIINVSPTPATPNIISTSSFVCSEGTLELTAQSTTLGSYTISGTSPTTTTSAPSPFYRLFEGARQQYLVRASELSTAGMTAGGITSVTFNTTAVLLPNNQNGFTVKAGFTPSADLSSGWMPGLGVVYGPQNLNSVVGANTFLFNAPVIWDGVSNLVIEICWDNDPDNTCSSGSPVCWGNTSTTSIATAPFASASRYYYSDNSSGLRDMCTTTLLTATSQTRPVMTFGFGNAVDFVWSPSYGLNTTTGATVIASGDVPTTYTVTASNVAGCSTTTSIAVSVTSTPQPLILESFQTDTILLCSNIPGLTIHLVDTVNYPSGFPSGTTFEWINYTIPTVGLDSFFVSFADNYTCNVVLPGAIGGCASQSDSLYYDFSTQAPLQLLSQDTIRCFGDSNGNAIASIVFGGTPPFHYVWKNSSYAVVKDTVHNDLADTLFNLSEGWYIIEITDKYGLIPPPPACYVIDSIFMVQPAVLLVSGLNPISPDCNGNSTGISDITVSGGTEPYSYLWNNGDTNEDAANVSAGTYTVIVTDYHNCVTTSSIIITQPDVLMAACSKTDVTINGLGNGTTTTSASGGTAPYSYLWNNGPTTATATGLIPGNYCVTVTDNNGCTTSCCIAVTEPDVLQATGTVTNITCRNAKDGIITMNPTGGVGPFTYYWIDGNTNGIRTNLSPIAYTVIVTDYYGATASASFSVIQPATFLVNNISKTNVRCFGKCTGKAIAAPVGGWGGYSYLWSTGETSSTILNLCAGTYTLTVTDAGGCVKSTVFNITQNPALTAVIVPLSAYSAQANVTGGVPSYTYLWNTVPNQYTATATALIPGTTYKVKVADSKNCSQVATIYMPLPKEADFGQTGYVVSALPNPTEDVITFQFRTGSTQDFKIMITDVTGRLVFEKQESILSGVHSIDFNLEGMTKGVYHALIYSNLGNRSIKIVLK